MSMTPENFRIGAGSLSIDGQDVGAVTPDGMVVTYEPDVHLHMTGQYGNTPAKASLIGMNLTLQVNIMEPTLANILKVFAGADGDTSRVKFGGLSGREIVGKELILTPNDDTPSWVFRNAVPTSSIDMAYQVENERVFQVTFTAMVDVGPGAPENENVAYIS